MKTPNLRRLSTLRAVGRRMAAADRYVLAKHSWGTVHGDIGARIVTQAAYLEAVFSRTGDIDLAWQAKRLGEQAAAKSGFV